MMPCGRSRSSNAARYKEFTNHKSKRTIARHEAHIVVSSLATVTSTGRAVAVRTNNVAFEALVTPCVIVNAALQPVEDVLVVNGQALVANRQSLSWAATCGHVQSPPTLAMCAALSAPKPAYVSMHCSVPSLYSSHAVLPPSPSIGSSA